MDPLPPIRHMAGVAIFDRCRWYLESVESDAKGTRKGPFLVATSTSKVSFGFDKKIENSISAII